MSPTNIYILQYIGTVLLKEYKLSETANDKPTMNIDDLILLLYHYWTRYTDHYAVEWERVQHALLILSIAYTSARPSTILQGRGKRDNDSLKYKDIQLFKVRNPQDRSKHIFIMMIRLRLMKGKRNKGVS